MVSIIPSVMLGNRFHIFFLSLAPQYSRHPLPQSLHVSILVSGSSEERVCSRYENTSDAVTLLRRAHVGAGSEDTVAFVRIFDDIIYTSLRFCARGGLRKVDFFAICSLDDDICRTIVAAFVIGTGDLTFGVRE